MKKLILTPFIALFLLSGQSCVKDKACVDKTVASEDGEMLAFAAANAMTPVRHSSGLYYQIVAGGSGQTPNLGSVISVTYTGKRMDGTIFEQVGAPTALFPLSQFIPGWQLGLQQIQKGGTIKLIIPSSLAYGCKGFQAIPGNAILYFEVTLADVQ
jgi:FKBP-type peptidyl-prolyl cis-trans isomerase FkpA